MKELCDFLREKCQLLFFLLFFEGSLCLIYGLYGLPWGPAGYTCLVTAVVTLGFLMAGFFRWKRKRRQLLILKRQAEQSLETADLPKAETPLENIYQEIIQDQEKRCQREQKESRKGRYNSDTLGGWLLLSALIRGSSKYKWLNPPYTKWPFKILRASEFAS